MNNIEIKDYNLIKSALNIEDRLEDCFSDVVNSYVEIGGFLNEIKDNKYYLLLDYKDIFEYVLDRFKLSKTTCSNFINLYKKFGEKNYYGHYSLKEEYEEYSYSQLVELISVPDSNLIDYSPGLSVREIRSIKKIENFNKKIGNILVDEIKKMYINFLDNKEILNRFIDPGLCYLDIDSDNLILYDEYVCFFIPCIIEYDNSKEECRFCLRVDLQENGTIKKKFSCNFSKYLNFKYYSFPCCHLDEEKTVSYAMKEFNKFYDNFISETESYFLDYEKTKQKEEEKISSISNFIAFSMKDLEKNNIVLADIDSSTKNLFSLILELDTVKHVKRTCLYKDKNDWVIEYEGIKIFARTYWIILKKAGKEKRINLDDFILLILKSGGVFYPIDFISYFNLDDENPTSE